MFYEIDIERHRVRLMAYENRNAAYDLSLFDDSSDYVPGSAAPERKEEVKKKKKKQCCKSSERGTSEEQTPQT